MTKKLATTIIVLASVLGVGYGLGRTVPAFAAKRQVRPIAQLPNGPQAWVAFEADVAVTEIGIGSHTQKFYRGSDGSTRMESYSPDRHQMVVTIHNFSNGLAYVMSPDGKWASMPTEKEKSPPVSPSYRADSVTATSEMVAGFECYRVKKLDSVAWLARQLNYFEIRTEFVAAGRIREYSNINLREPPKQLFLPPQGEDVRRVSQAKDLLGPPPSRGPSQ